MRIGLLILLAITLLGGKLPGKTFFIFVEETVDNTYVESVSPVSEGLLLGLFDRGHIVFDDTGMEAGFEWEKPDFGEFLRKGGIGGAEYFIAVNVQSRSFNAGIKSNSNIICESTLRYYCFDIEKKKLLKTGIMEENNAGKESKLDRTALGMILGELLSAEIEELCCRERGDSLAGRLK
jgi:hypothetical protein